MDSLTNWEKSEGCMRVCYVCGDQMVSKWVSGKVCLRRLIRYAKVCVM